MSQKDLDRAKIQRHIEEYLAKGNEIHEVDHTANRGYRDPIKHTRKEQVDKMRKKSISRG